MPSVELGRLGREILVRKKGSLAVYIKKILEEGGVAEEEERGVDQVYMKWNTTGGRTYMYQ
jgi:hypothetical protein